MTTVTVDLSDTSHCPPGRWEMIIRWKRPDRDAVQAAAAALGMPATSFIRLIACQAAKQVLELRNGK